MAASEYEYTRAEENVGRKSVPDLNSRGAREEACVILSVEYAGDKSEFSFDEKDADTLIIQGFSYVSGSNNACYQQSILLKGESGIFEFPFKGCVRNDVALACKDQVNVEKSGFCVNISKAELAHGNYRVGILMTNRFAREKLFAFSNKYMVVK